jgi:NTP pyrophosphatase (non-canonical NTP hydrolase)
MSSDHSNKDLKTITQSIIAFNQQRDWTQFHNPKDLSLAISIEAAELNQLFLWKGADEVDKQKVEHELADVLIFAFTLAHTLNLDIPEIIHRKLQMNEIKYPVEKSKGSSKKHTEL